MKLGGIVKDELIQFVLTAKNGLMHGVDEDIIIQELKNQKCPSVRSVLATARMFVALESSLL